MSRKRYAVNHEVMHEFNRALVLDSLRKQSAQSRAKLSKLTGLTRSAISNLTDELLRADMIQEVGLEASTGGRRGIMLALNPDGGCVVALKFNAVSAQCALLSLTGNIVWSEIVPLDDTSVSHVLQICHQMIGRALANNNGARPVLGIGVAAPGLISAEGDMIYSKFMDWRDVSFRSEWQEQYGVPVSVGNMVGLAALGESRFGSAADDSHFFYVEIGYGAGAGVVIDHQLYRGKHGMAGEIGYMQICGEGDVPINWQEFVNIPAFSRAAKRLIASGKGSSLDAGNLSFEALVDALRAGDGVAYAALEELSHHLGAGLASLYNVFNISVFILGGELGCEYELCLPQLRRDAEKRLVAQPPGGIDIRISRMELDAALMGAAARVFDSVLIEPSLPVRI